MEATTLLSDRQDKSPSESDSEGLFGSLKPFKISVLGSQADSFRVMEQNISYSIIVGIGLLIGFPVLLAVGSYLWNNKWRPMQSARGKVVDKFGGIMSRAQKFIFKEDSLTLSPKVKSKFLRKLITIKKIYLALFLTSLVMIWFMNNLFAIPLVIMLMVMFVRTSAVFRQRHDIMMKMFEVAASEFRYGRGTELEVRKYVKIVEWENKVVPSKTIITYPSAFKVENPQNRDSFERHFNSSVTDENLWDYEWEPTKPLVICTPVPHLKDRAPYPGAEINAWDEFAVGDGLRGPVVYNVSKTPHILVCGPTGSGKSVLQRNILFHCIQHNDMWRFLGVDVKRVELSPYAKYKNTVLGIGTSLEDGAEIVAYAKKQMEDRYEHMESVGVNHFLDLPKDPSGKLPYYAILLMIDEAFMFMGLEGNKTDEGKARDELHGQASSMIGDIARLGRAAGVHLVIATQRPDATVIKGELKANLDTRIAAGRLNSVSSSMILDSMEGTLLPGHIKGRGAISISGEVEQFQGYFAEQKWIDEWLAKPENKWREPQLFDDDTTNDLLNLDDLESQIPGIGEETAEVLDEAKEDFYDEQSELPIDPVSLPVAPPASPVVAPAAPLTMSKPVTSPVVKATPPAPRRVSQPVQQLTPTPVVTPAFVDDFDDEDDNDTNDTNDGLIGPDDVRNAAIFGGLDDSGYDSGSSDDNDEKYEELESEEEYLKRIFLPSTSDETTAVAAPPVFSPAKNGLPKKPAVVAPKPVTSFPKRPTRPQAAPAKQLDIEDYNF